jgi:FtsH-binding integral membrane protein
MDISQRPHSPVSEISLAEQVTDPFVINVFARRVFAVFTLQWVYNFIIAWILRGNQQNYRFHRDSWGITAGLTVLWLLIIFDQACLGRLIRKSPRAWFFLAGFTACGGYLIAALMSYFGSDLVFYCTSACLAASAGLCAASLVSKNRVHFTRAAMFSFGGVVITYIVFIIFSSLSINELAISSLAIIAVGVYLNHAIYLTLPGPFYHFDLGLDWIGASIVVWLELILSPVRMCEFLQSHAHPQAHPIIPPPIVTGPLNAGMPQPLV